MCLNPPLSPLTAPSSPPHEDLDSDPNTNDQTPAPIDSQDLSSDLDEDLENDSPAKLPQVSDALLSALNTLGPVLRVIPLHQAPFSISPNVPNVESSPYNSTAPIGIYRGAGGYGTEPSHRVSTEGNSTEVSYTDGTIQQVVVPLHSEASTKNATSVPQVHATPHTVNDAGSNKQLSSNQEASTSDGQSSVATTSGSTSKTSEHGVLRTLVIRLPRDAASGAPLVESFTTALGEPNDPIVLQPSCDDTDTRWDIIKLPNVTGLGPKVLEVKVPSRYRLTQAMLVQTKRRSKTLDSDLEPPADKRRKME